MPHEWATVVNFDPTEFERPELVSYKLIRQLDNARAIARVSIQITSDVREGDEGSHGDGEAVDIADNLSGRPLASWWRFKVLRALLQVGFNRIGVYDRHIHVDISDRLPQDVIWHGTSS